MISKSKMEGKKISFGFMKTKKVEKTPVEEKKEFIECVEEKSIRVIGGEEIKEITPLVIPMKPNTLITAERLKKIAEEVESAMDVPEPGEKLPEDEKKPPDETLDQMAVRELLEDAKKERKEEKAELTVPVPSKPVMDGEKEMMVREVGTYSTDKSVALKFGRRMSTLDDYESVPIQDFGMAMLRGMGWQPNKDQSKYKQPQLRPKGLGLGADKVVSENQKKKSNKDNKEELAIVKNCYVKITTGKYSGYYGKVVSLDEDNGRVMVDIAIKKETVSLSEFMIHPVTKSEFDKESKVINVDSFEEYKKNEKVSQKSSRSDSPKVDKEPSSSKKADLDKDYKKESRRDDNKRSNKEKDNSNGSRDRHRRDSSSSEDRSRRRKKDKKRHSSKDSLSSLSDNDKRKHKKRYSSSDSDSPRRDRRKKTPEGKRDIDKKRKGKKKKRDRDRSPNYKKHRK